MVVKKLKEQSKQSLDDIKLEASNLSALSRLPNIISFIGYVDGDDPALVTSYAKYGSVESALIDSNMLNDIVKDMPKIIQVFGVFLFSFHTLIN